MNPLYHNDRPGVFPESYYAATADIPPQRPALDGDMRADVAVIGAGSQNSSAARSGRVFDTQCGLQRRLRMT